MKIKKILLVLVLFVSMFVLTGCGTKKPITEEQFKTAAESYGLVVIDAIDQMSQYKIVKSALIGKSNDGWQVEFYILDGNSSAKSMYDENRSIFEKYKGSTTKEKYITIKEYSMYSLNSNGKYMYLCKINNTLLYANVDEQYENDVKNFAKKIGY